MIPFSPPYIPDSTKTEILKVLESGWITTGPKTKELEDTIAKYIGLEHALAVNSATAGLQLMLHWFGVGPGDEVIIPAYTYCATANVILHEGATPVLVDVGEDFNIDMEAVRKAITNKTKAIIPVDIAGLPCDYNTLSDIILSDAVRQKFQPSNDTQKQLGRILILEDAAHALGATYQSKPIGKIVDATVFSFHAVKNLTTAEGGAIVLNLPNEMNNAKIYQNLRVKSLHGQTKDAFTKINMPGRWEYDVVEPGFKCNMPDILAVIGLEQFKVYDKVILKRKQIFEYYVEQLSKYDWAILPSAGKGATQTSYHLFMLRIQGAKEQVRNKIIEAIFEKQVSVNVHFKPLPLLTAYQNLGYEMTDYPNSYQLYQHEVTLPMYYTLSMEDAKKVVEAVINSVNEILS